MSSIPRLPYIITSIIENKWIKDLIPTKSLNPETSTHNLETTAFLCFFNGSAISDGFYNIPATSQIALSTNSYILLTNYSLSYKSHLHLTITGADLQPTTPKFEGPTISIEKNPSIANIIRRYKFLKLQLSLNDIISDNTEESAKFLLNLSKMTETLNNPEEHQSEDQGSDILEKQTGQINRVLQMVRQEKPSGKVIEISYNLGIDVFPSYALEYLKHKYNVV